MTRSTFVMNWGRRFVDLIGPFASEAVARDWAKARESNPLDTPCWQLVDLDIPDGVTFAITARAPDTGPLRAYL